MNDIEKVVLESISEITGLKTLSIEKIKSENLFKRGVLNSMALVSLINMIERKMDINIDIKKCKLSDFESIDAIVNTVNRTI